MNTTFTFGVFSDFVIHICQFSCIPKKCEHYTVKFQSSNTHMRVCVCVCGLTIYTAQIGPFSHFLCYAKKQTILCTQGANFSPKTKCNFGKASGMCSTLRELGITGLVCVIQWSKCKSRFTAKFTILNWVTTNLNTMK